MPPSPAASTMNDGGQGSHILDFPVGGDVGNLTAHEESEAAKFGRMLRDSRVRRGISLTEIANHTKISQRHLASLERGDISHWPRGMYRRAMVRAYCTCVGLQAEDVVDNFTRVFADERPADDASPRVDAPVRTSPRSQPIMAMVAIAMMALSGLGLTLWIGPRLAASAMSVARAVMAITPSASEPLQQEAGPSPAEQPQSFGVQVQAPLPPDATIAADIEGELDISSDPAGAQVTVDGIGWGVTPLRIQHLPLGYKRLRLTQAGYLGEERAVTLDASNHLRRLHVRLRPSE
jgi:cytoskeleton protein RodZ